MAEPSDRDPSVVPLTPIATAAASSDGGQFTVTMVVSSGRRSSPALRFSVHIVNTGDDTAVLANPYEGLTVEVADEHGQPVALRPPPRAAKTGRWEQALEARQRYLRLEALKVGGRPQSAEQARAERISLEADHELELDLAAESVRTAPDSTESRPVGTGPYLLRVVLPLGWEDPTGKYHVILRSDPPVTVSAS
jgi:hypothetical protein